MKYQIYKQVEKPDISFEKTPLLFLCNEAFHSVKGFIPGIRDTKKYDSQLAFVLGISSGILAAKTGEKLVDKINQAGIDIDVKTIATHCAAAAALSEPIERMIIPETYADWETKTSAYKWGVRGVKIGAVAYALYIFFKK